MILLNVYWLCMCLFYNIVHMIQQFHVRNMLILFLLSCGGIVSYVADSVQHLKVWFPRLGYIIRTLIDHKFEELLIHVLATHTTRLMFLVGIGKNEHHECTGNLWDPQIIWNIYCIVKKQCTRSHGCTQRLTEISELGLFQYACVSRKYFTHDSSGVSNVFLQAFCFVLSVVVNFVRLAGFLGDVLTLLKGRSHFGGTIYQRSSTCWLVSATLYELSYDSLELTENTPMLKHG